jgi:predicted RNA-binding protein
MCQATVFLNGKVIMRDVLIVEPLPEGVRLVALFEPVQIVPAKIRQIDLMKHKVILESVQESEEGHGRYSEAARADPALDGAQRRTRA